MSVRPYLIPLVRRSSIATELPRRRELADRAPVRAEFAGRLARKYHWHSVALVTTTPQKSRARIRMKRCFSGPLYVVTAPIALASWPDQIVYEWGAIIKALVVQRSC